MTASNTLAISDRGAGQPEPQLFVGFNTQLVET